MPVLMSDLYKNIIQENPWVQSTHHLHLLPPLLWRTWMNFLYTLLFYWQDHLQWGLCSHFRCPDSHQHSSKWFQGNACSHVFWLRKGFSCCCYKKSLPFKHEVQNLPKSDHRFTLKKRTEQKAVRNTEKSQFQTVGTITMERLILPSLFLALDNFSFLRSPSTELLLLDLSEIMQQKSEQPRTKFQWTLFRFAKYIQSSVLQSKC